MKECDPPTPLPLSCLKIAGELLPLEAGKSGVYSVPFELPAPPFLSFLSFGDFLPDLESFDFNSGVFDDVAPLEEFAPAAPCFTLFLDFIVSVFKLIGLGRPCNLRNNPQALHNTWPVSSLLHKGVV